MTFTLNCRSMELAKESLSFTESYMAEPRDVTQEAAQQVLTDALRQYVGLGKQYSVAAFARATGIPERTIKSYQGG